MFTAIRVLVGVACTFDPKSTWRQARAILGSPPRVRGSGVGRGGGAQGGGAQGARAPPSALGLVHIVHRIASSSTPLATLSYHLLQKKQLRRQLETYLIPRSGRKP